MYLVIRVLACLVAATPLVADISLAKAAGSEPARTLPKQVLLTRQPRQQCELSKPPEHIGANDARVVMLDYERQCYRQLLEIERAKVKKLQVTVRPAPKATHSNNRGAYNRAIRRDRQMAGR